VVLLLLAFAVSASSPRPRKQLIEFGWDEPGTRFMRDHIAQLQASPFDGCVFHVDYETARGDSGSFTWTLWGRHRFDPRDLDSARADLLATRFGRFRTNFLRVNVTPGNLDWFEDHSAVMSNLEQAARLAKLSGGPGILFDVEPYEGQLWRFREQVKKRPGSWPEVAARVRSLGAEAMRALERGYPGLTVFFTMAYSMPLHELNLSKRPLMEAQYGLFVPFLDGMVSAAGPGVVLVDGPEISYPFREPERFAAKADSMRHAVRRLAADPARYTQRLSRGFGIWLDFEWRKRGWDANDPSRNYFSPAVFARAVGAALQHADHYVWIYTETPRWWTPEGGHRALPAVYDSVLRAVRR
jgi:hypothetical protein